MYLLNVWLLLSTWLTGALCTDQGQKVIIPAPNGTYNVGRVTLQATNENSLQPFAPRDEAPALQLSVFYPANSTKRVEVPYMPLEVAQFEDLNQSTIYMVDSPSGTFERLNMQLAPSGSSIAQYSKEWPLLVFGSALGTNRNFYNALISQVASSGYVVITYDTPYTTDIVLYDNGTTVFGNSSILFESNHTSLIIKATDETNIRAQDTSYIIDQFSNTTFVSSVIPGCNSCLNTSHVGVFGHSIGGATAATVTLNDTIVAGALDFDGTVWGDVVEQGLNKPFMLMVEEGNTRNAVNETPFDNWARMWPRLSSAKFDLIVNDSSHYTFSDYPLVFELLDILPANDTILEGLLLTRMNGTRAFHIVTTYATSFFDWLLKDGSPDLIAASSSLFPEVTLDTDTTSVGDASRWPGSVR